MLPASNRGVGMNIGFPDVCLTPPVAAPIPYPNFGLHVLAAPFVPNVFVSMMPGLNMASRIVTTMGDEPGVMGPWIKLMGAFTMGNPTVMLGGLPGINLLCPTTGNNYNNALGAVLVPAITTVLFTRRPPGETSAQGLPGEALVQGLPGESLAQGLPGEAPAQGLSRDDLSAFADAGAPVRAEMVRDGIGMITVPLFTFDLPTVVYNEIDALGAAGLQVLILDLRGNPGGELDASARLAGDFLDEGTVIAHIAAADGDETVLKAPAGSPYPFPLVLLVDGRTASAAEIFAGCLQAHGRAVIVGEGTYGKGAVQRVMPAAEGQGAVYTTVARCTPAGGASIDGVGVQPDVAVGRDDAAEGHADEDVQRNVAIAVALTLRDLPSPAS